MKIPTWRFLLYLVVAFLSVPPIYGEAFVYASFAYYSLMLALTLVFMRMDSIWLRFWIPEFRSGVLKGLINFPVFFILGFLVNRLFPVEIPQSDIEPSFGLILLIVLVAPITEELMFRGYVQEYFRGRLKAEWAILMSALIFSLFHPIQLFPQVFIAGVFLSYLREASGSILPGIVVHVLNNAVGILTSAG